ncbi:hypothetical protein Poli38472_012206 [Pythium oligandrum]|uniref:Uncharacterized protein n=1 Tax=Pythium oligandrum TaxID=41045 RepID=A0A8K1CPG0_PYTOL|nr:hypothetical protein Poli38472_012206 [Pythium oligandrum]|eukprot:TMW67090.1 hypothetical protein Poli38472_012206 [Pythium oligandrum]
MSAEWLAAREREQEETAQRRYKSTYYTRKNEIAELEEEARALTEKIQQLRGEHSNVSGVLASVQENAMLWSGLQSSTWIMAEAQSALSNRLSAQVINPLETFIHLSADSAQRQRTLLSLRDEKLRVAAEFMARRTRFVDLRRSHRQVESSETPNGDIIVEQLVVVPFPDISSVKLVYDSLVLALSHLQFVVWDLLGISCVCETEEKADDCASQLRYFTMIVPGTDLEKNTASFRHYFKESELFDGACGLTVVDFVDEDELYPYNSDHRVRLDVTGATMACRSGTEPNSGVSLVRWSRSRIHRPPKGISSQSIDALRDCIPRWTEATVQTVRDYVAATANSQLA